MPMFSMLAYSNFDLGRSSTDISGGTFAVSGPSKILKVQDDDTVFDDESGGSGETLDTSQQTLAEDFDGTYPSGRVVQSVFKYTVTNNTTGETGTAHLIRIYTGTDPSSPGSQDGDYYNVFTIPVSSGDSITLSGGNAVGQASYSSIFVCFTRGTLLLTPTGEVPVESLKTGDVMITRERSDEGSQDVCKPIRWIGSRHVQAINKRRPIRIRAGALGKGLPKRDLVVSRQHRMMVTSKVAERMFGEKEVLVPAIKLTQLPGIFIDYSFSEVEYFHILFDQHEVIYAEGAPTESLFTGPEALKSIPIAVKQEIFDLFPQLARTEVKPEFALPIPPQNRQKELVARHLKNRKPLLELYSA